MVVFTTGITACGKNVSLLIKAIEQGINAPKASSCGRLFDAVACALGLTADQISWEGEAACALENCALQCHNQNELITGETLPLTADNTINLRPLWQMLADDTQTIPERAFRFHVLLANTVAGWRMIQQPEKYGYHRALRRRV